MDKKLVMDKNKLFATDEAEMHEIRIAPDSEEYLRVWVRQPTYFELEKAQMKLFNVNMKKQDVDFDMADLQRYMFETFIEKTEPSLSTIEMLRVSPFVGQQIKAILPDPFAMAGGMDEGKDEA